MAKNTAELTASFPHLALKVSKGEWKTTIRIKSNGSEYGGYLAKGLPILDAWASTSMPESMISLLQRSRAKGSMYQRAALILCGRGEYAHNMGISVNTAIIGKDAATHACKAAGQASASGFLADMETALAKQQSTAKRKASTAKRKAEKVAKVAKVAKVIKAIEPPVTKAVTTGKENAS